MALKRPIDFYGPWEIVLIEADAFGFLAFKIEGSGNADGVYIVDDGQPNLRVEGAKWTLELGGIWEDKFGPSEFLNRKTTSGPPNGLTVNLDSHRMPPGGFGPLIIGFALDCICRDETLNPPQIPNPYDFTYKPS